MNVSPIKIRLVSFGYSLVGVLPTLLLMILSSPDFSNFVTSHLGSGSIGALILLLAPELAKYLRNRKQLKKLGAEDSSTFLI